MCNEKLKFGNLWSKAAALGCDYIATGHYAIIEHSGDRAVLRKGLDREKISPISFSVYVSRSFDVR